MENDYIIRENTNYPRACHGFSEKIMNNSCKSINYEFDQGFP
jgi:hypothetical protein